jgi:hypothetical protein
MSDNAPNDLGLQPSEPLGPVSPDAATVARSIADHEAFKASNYSEHDPASVCYHRPDLAAKYKAEADLAFNATMARHGARLPVAETPEQLAARNFNSQWSMGEMPKALVAQIDARVVAAEALSKDDQAKAVAAIKSNIGETRWHQLVNTVAQPNMSKAAFITAEGNLQYDRLVAQAKVARPNITPAALSDRYTIETLANFGRYQAAKQRARG